MHKIKKIFNLLLLFFSASVYALPQQGSLHFRLTHVIENDHCPAFLKNMDIQVDYNYDFENTEGMSYLKSLGSTLWIEPLYPLGLMDYHGFMSDMTPVTLLLEHDKITIYRVIFHIYPSGFAKLMMMVGMNGECIVESEQIPLIAF